MTSVSGPPILSQTAIERIGKFGGLLLFVIILWLPGLQTELESPLSPAAQRMLAVTALMGMLWLTQAIPIAATSLLPLVLFPLLAIQDAGAVSKSYINESIFLYMGGFIIALGIEKWGLHRRIALHIVRLLGTGLKQVVLGFMLATAFISMWISNTATTLLMLPIGLAMISSLRELSVQGTAPSHDPALLEVPPETERVIHRLSTVLMLGIGYAASLGGMATLVGTPTNVVFVGIWNASFDDLPGITAGQWIAVFTPMALVYVLLTWLLLTFRLPALPGKQQLGPEFFRDKVQALGRPSRPELLMLAIFVATALLWIFRKPFGLGTQPLLPGWGDWVEAALLKLGASEKFADKAIEDSTVAIGMALLMFFLPATRDERGNTVQLMDWETAGKLPWEILLLFGGGFALADGFRESGLSLWAGQQLADAAQGWPLWLIVGVVCLMITFLSELTSNVATATAVLPILGGTALALDIDPRLVMIPATVAASCGFMLPIATPPNAIIFGAVDMRMSEMVRPGFLLDLLGVVLVTVTSLWLLPLVLGIQ